MRHGLWITAGVIVWALHFTAIYGYAGYACARGMAQSVPWVVALATLAATLALVVVGVRAFLRRAGFVPCITAAVAAIALYAILLEAITALWVAPCVAR